MPPGACNGSQQATISAAFHLGANIVVTHNSECNVNASVPCYF